NTNVILFDISTLYSPSMDQSKLVSEVVLIDIDNNSEEKNELITFHPIIEIPDRDILLSGLNKKLRAFSTEELKKKETKKITMKELTDYSIDFKKEVENIFYYKEGEDDLVIVCDD